MYGIAVGVAARLKRDTEAYRSFDMLPKALLLAVLLL